MMDLADTIIPKSDQLNADDLIAGPMTIRISAVSRASTPEQPLSLAFDGDGGKPYKPCKSMRRVLIRCWGSDGTKWAGRSMSIYRDDRVRFGGAEVGGIRISHVSHIDGPIRLALTETKAKRVPYQVLPLVVASPLEAPTLETAKAAGDFIAVLSSRLNAAETREAVDAIAAHERIAKLHAAGGKNSERVRELIDAATARVTAAVSGDEGRDPAPPPAPDAAPF